MILTLYYMYATLIQWWRLGALKNKINGTLNSQNALLLSRSGVIHDTKRQRSLENLLFHHDDRIGCTIVPKKKVHLAQWVTFPKDYKFFPIYLEDHRTKLKSPHLYILVRAVLDAYTKHDSEVIQVEKFGELVAWKSTNKFELILKTDLENLTKLVHCFSQNNIDINHEMELLEIETIDIDGVPHKIKYEKKYSLDQTLRYSLAPVHWAKFASEMKELYSKIRNATNPKIKIENGSPKPDDKKVPVYEVKPIKKDGRRSEEKNTLDVSTDYRRQKHKSVTSEERHKHRTSEDKTDKRMKDEAKTKEPKTEAAQKEILTDVKKTTSSSDANLESSGAIPEFDTKVNTPMNAPSISTDGATSVGSSKSEISLPTIKTSSVASLLTKDVSLTESASSTKNGSSIKNASSTKNAPLTKSSPSTTKTSYSLTNQITTEPSASSAKLNTNSSSATSLTTKVSPSTSKTSPTKSDSFPRNLIKIERRKSPSKSGDEVRRKSPSKSGDEVKKDTKTRDKAKEETKNKEEKPKEEKRFKFRFRSPDDAKKKKKEAKTSEATTAISTVITTATTTGTTSATTAVTTAATTTAITAATTTATTTAGVKSETSNAEASNAEANNGEASNGGATNTGQDDGKRVKTRTKPPNILVYADSALAKENVKNLLNAILNKEKYTVYDFPVHTEDAAWNDSTVLIIICGSVAPELTGQVLQFFLNGGQILCLCSDFLHRVLNTFTTAEVREHELVRFSYGDWQRVKMMHHIFCYQASPAKKQFSKDSDQSNHSNGSSPIATKPPSLTEVTHNGKLYNLQVQVLGAEETWQTPSLILAKVKNSEGKAVFSQVHLEIDPTQYEDDENKYAALKDSNEARLGILRDILSRHLDIDCDTNNKITYSPAYFLGRHDQKVDLLTNNTNVVNNVVECDKIKLVFCAKDVDPGQCTSERLPIFIHSCPSTFSTVQYYETLKTESIGRLVIYSDALTSSQDVLNKELKHGLVCIPRVQTKAVGRANNSWITPIGNSSFSIQLHVPMSSAFGRSLPLLQHLVPLSIVSAIKKLDGYSGIDIGLKWPNDIYANKTIKIGGVVASSSVNMKSAVVNLGCGMNLDNANPTTCLNELIRLYNVKHGTNLKPLSYEKYFALVFNEMERIYDTVQLRDDIDYFFDLYYEHWLHNNSDITIRANNSEVKAKIIGVDDFGFLKVRLEDGSFSVVQPDGNSFDLMRGLIQPKVF